MATDTPNAVQKYLTTVVMGTLAAQKMLHQGHNPGAEDVDSEQLRLAIADLEAQGIDCDALASAFIGSILLLWMKPENVKVFIREVAQLLWKCMGDGTDTDPPELYYRTACAVHSVMLGILDPSCVS